MFHDSCVKKVYTHRIVEENTSMPDKISPVYLGSSRCIMSLDATGMQGANNRLQKAFACYPDACDMYVVKNGMVGDVLTPHNTIPLCHLSYSVTVDNRTYETEDILAEGSMFRRDSDIRDATVSTAFILNDVRVECRAVIPFGTAMPIFGFRFKNFHQNIPIPDEVHEVCVRVRVCFTTRKGKPIYDELTFDGRDALNAFVRGHENYRLTMKLSSTEGRFAFEGSAATAELTAKAGKEWSQWTSFGICFDGIHTIAERESLLAAHRVNWEKFWSETASVDYGRTEEVFLFNQSKYLLKMGYEPALGMPIGHPFNFPGCWEASVFWDAHFAMDALMRSGSLDCARQYLKFLLGVMRTTGKPFPWMFIYDGTTFLDEKRDIAPLVISAQAMIAVRYYEIFREDETFRSEIYPMLEACCDYAATHMFGKDREGRWVVSMAVSNDVVDEEGDEVNQTYTNVWFAVLFQKLIEYSEKFGIEISPRYREIAGNLYLEQNEREYLHCRGQSAAEARWASWLPFLYYPTECMPLVDGELFEKTRKKYCYVDLYMEKQNSYQPWTEFIECQSDHRAGALDEAYDLLRHGMEHTFGPGYFSEIGPRQQTVGAPPYSSAHSSFVSAVIDTFVSGSIWEKSAGLFENLPLALAGERIEIKNMFAPQNLRVRHAVYSPESLGAELEGNLEGLRLTMRIPARFRDEDLRVFCNGAVLESELDWRRHLVSVVLPHGKTYRLEIR